MLQSPESLNDKKRLIQIEHCFIFRDNFVIEKIEKIRNFLKSFDVVDAQNNTYLISGVDVINII